MTQRHGISPPVVSTTSPNPIGAIEELSRWIAGPPAREIAPATPPPCFSSVFAALAIASTSSLVMSVSRTSITDPTLGDLGGLFLAGEPLPPAPDRRDELREVHLERVEDLVGVVLGAQADLALAGPGVLDDVLGGALGLLGDLLLGDHPLLALAGFLDDPLSLALGLGQHLLALL